MEPIPENQTGKVMEVVINDIQIAGHSRVRLKRSENLQIVLSKSIAIILWQLIFSAAGIYLSLESNLFMWFCGQIILGVSMLQWFFILHDLAHQSLFKNKKINAIMGHLASLFCLLPYFPWLNVHNAHHKWTGWKEKDPTIPEMSVESLSNFQIKLIDFCWKYWIPIFAVNYTTQTFYNFNRLRKLFPKKEYIVFNGFSILWIITFFCILIPMLGFATFIKLWALAFFIYIFISDPMLISQHTHLDYHDEHQNEKRPVRFLDQPLFTRTVKYPEFIEKYLFYNMTKHGLHHQYPWLPMYQLSNIPEPKENNIPWYDWLQIAKSMPGHILIFKSHKDTGIKL